VKIDQEKPSGWVDKEEAVEEEEEVVGEEVGEEEDEDEGREGAGRGP
jgi:hypothetical protein